MRWNVEGADLRTGRDRLITVEALDETGAERIARRKGMLIAAIHPVKVLSPAEKLEQMMAGKLDASTVTTPGPVETMAAEWNAQVTERRSETESDHADPDDVVAPDPDELTTPDQHDPVRESISPKEPSRKSAKLVSSSTLFAAGAPDASVEPAPGDSAAAQDSPEEGHRALNYRGVVGRIAPVRFIGHSGAGAPDAPEYLGLRVAAFILGMFAILAYTAGLVGLAGAVLSMIGSVYWRSTPGAIISMILTLAGAASPLALGAVLHGMSAACLALRDIARNSFVRH